MSTTPPQAVHRLSGGVQLLAGDDDGFMRDLLRRVLPGAGMQVTTCGHALDAVGQQAQALAGSCSSPSPAS